jgi:hypothetical protein
MLYVSRRDGTTRSYDLLSNEGRREFLLDARQSNPDEVRSVALASNGARADLPVPRRFRVVSYEASLELDREGEPTAEIVSAICDGVVLSMTMYLNGRSGRFRFDVDRRGTPRYRPPS